MAEIIEENGVKYKICTKCGELLPLDRFSKKTQSKDGYQSWCRKCTSENQRRNYHNPKPKVSNIFAPSAPILPDELSDKTLGRCTPRDLMTVLKLWGYDGTLEFKKTIRLSEI